MLIGYERKSIEHHAQLGYTMKAVFWELPSFKRLREGYLQDKEYEGLQANLMKDPEAGDVNKGTGGLRKLRYADAARGKGKRGGLRVIYYWNMVNDQFWLFTLYDKDEAVDLTANERKALKEALDRQIKDRSARK
jgi:hypothetical protein